MDRVDRDAVSGTALLGLAILYLLASRGLPVAPDSAEPGPAFFPRLVGLLLAGLAVIILVRGVRGSLAARARHPEGTTLRPVFLVVATLLYIVVFEPLGFVASTLAYSLAVTVLFRPNRGWHWLWLPTLTTGFAYALFARGLGVILPGIE